MLHVRAGHAVCVVYILMRACMQYEYEGRTHEYIEGLVFPLTFSDFKITLITLILTNNKRIHLVKNS